MKCQVCDKEFFSMEWYEVGNMAMCDECVLDIYRAKIRYKQGEIGYIDGKIRELERKK